MSSTASSSSPQLKYKRPVPKPEVKEGFAWERVCFGVIAAATLAYDIYYTIYVHEPAAELLFPDEFNEFSLSEVIPVNHDTSLFKFKAKVLPIIKGSQVAAPSHVIIKDDSCQIARAYTPINFLKDYVEILVKNYPGGSISPMLHGLKVGEKVHMRGPITTLPYRPNVVKELGMV